LVLDWWLAFVQTRLPVYSKAFIVRSLVRPLCSNDDKGL